MGAGAATGRRAAGYQFWSEDAYTQDQADWHRLSYDVGMIPGGVSEHRPEVSASLRVLARAARGHH